MSDRIRNIALISSAGAGKTHALTLRFLFLYLNKRNYPLDSLYGITFTNEAAFEMKERILRYLNLLIENNPKSELEEDVIEYFQKYFPNLKERARHKKRYLLNNLSELNISTFHSLFASFLSTIPFAAGILPGYEIIDETEEGMIFDKIVTEFFAQAWKDDNLAEVIADLLEQQETRLRDSITSFFRDIIPWLDFLEELVNSEQSIKAEYETRRQNFIDSLYRLKNFLEEHQASACSRTTGSVNKYFAGFMTKLERLLKNGDMEMLQDRRIFPGVLDKKYFKSFCDNLGEAAAEFKKIKEQLEADRYKYLEALSDHEILVRLKPILKLHQLFQREKQRRNLITFDDIERYTIRALKNNPELDYLYFKLSKEIRHLMIDEFQDTTYCELEILEPIIAEITSVSPEEKSFFFVGDPYQAVFRWRGGTPVLFDLLIDEYKGKIEEERLTVNHRSKEAIIKLVNRILDKDDQVKPDNRGGWIRLESVGDFTDMDSGKEAVKARTAAIIKDLCENYGYDFSDIAVLVRTNEFGAAVADKLAEENIPYITASRSTILDDTDVQFMLNILRFLDNPEDDLALSKVLLSSVFAIKEETIVNLKATKQTIFLNLSRFHPDWEVSRKLKTLLSFVQFSNIYELIYAVYKELKLTLSYGLATLLDIALDYTRKGVNSLSAFLKWIEGAGRAMEVKHSRQEGVRILTVHKAKGLEFEVVIMPDIEWRLHSQENKKLLFSYEAEGSRPKKIYWRKIGKCIDGLVEAEEVRVKRDELNLLYVALTRAKEGIFILGFNHLKKSDGFWGGIIRDKLGGATFADGEISRKEKRSFPQPEEERFGMITEEKPFVREERSLYSPTERGVEIIESFRRKRIAYGLMVHYALSRITWLDDLNLDEVVGDIVETLKNTYARLPEEEKEVEDKVEPLLLETFQDPELRFLFFQDGRKVDCKNELPIYFEEKNRDVAAQIDRLIIMDTSVFIIDYKTGEEKDEYRHQMEIYKRGIKKIFPKKDIKAFLIFVEKERGKKIVEV